MDRQRPARKLQAEYIEVAHYGNYCVIVSDKVCGQPVPSIARAQVQVDGACIALCDVHQVMPRSETQEHINTLNASLYVSVYSSAPLILYRLRSRLQRFTSHVPMSCQLLPRKVKAQQITKHKRGEKQYTPYIVKKKAFHPWAGRRFRRFTPVFNMQYCCGCRCFVVMLTLVVQLQQLMITTHSLEGVVAEK